MAGATTIKQGAAECPGCGRTIANPPGLHAHRFGRHPGEGTFEMECPECGEVLEFEKVRKRVVMPERWRATVAGPDRAGS